jgi:hypothetical protein
MVKKIVKKQVPAVVKKAYNWGLENKKSVAIAIIILVAAVVFTSQLRAIISVGILALAGSFAQIYKRALRVPPAVEFVTFGTVMVGYVYGPWAGAIFGAVVTLSAEVISSAVDAFIIGYVPSRAIIGFTAAYMTGYSIVFVGIAMTLLYNLLAQPLYLLQPDFELRMKVVAFVVVNIIFNILVFRMLAEPILFLMG